MSPCASLQPAVQAAAADALALAVLQKSGSFYGRPRCTVHIDKEFVQRVPIAAVAVSGFF